MKPNSPPPRAVIALTWMLSQYDWRIKGWKRSPMFCSVKLPAASWKLPTTKKRAGKIRKKRAKARKGTTPSQAHDHCRIGGRLSGAVRVAFPTTWAMGRQLLLAHGPPLQRGGAGREFQDQETYLTFAPTTLSHFVVTRSLAVLYWSRVGNWAFA